MIKDTIDIVKLYCHTTPKLNNEQADSLFQGIKYQITNAKQLRISKKIGDNMVSLIDLRIWHCFNNDNHYFPTKRGLLLNVDVLKAILPDIQALLVDDKV